ncbi:Cytochrome c biogenesis ATP-binding export protein CcmA [Vibrio stylophorae]|uniref:Cytochrome c biogenesis ATP-binding export protein CcmA n=1 Tax=Vibrio stylophorae TaxID=659351 RepID=A0ABN8DVL3_9VIBR|nr:cytochrome c biogenesis heme-transporting ATPase CcmA [Vibrio stylophorae]CAH0534082.1 Cytochrome c biogenesis ATP-binding export protein CcmA [Vibrio stylophorae]
MLDVDALSCQRGDLCLFEHLSFSVHPGELVQIEGANGAGKTTLLRILAGLSQADSGSVRWQGERTSDNRLLFHDALLFLGHQPGLKAQLSAYENLAFYSQCHGHQADVDAIEQALADVGLLGFEHVPAGQLSAGQQRRVSLARLWLSDKPLWILDEPLTAIDKQGVKHLTARFVAHVAAGGSIVMTTHQDLVLPQGEIKRIRLGAS